MNVLDVGATIILQDGGLLFLLRKASGVPSSCLLVHCWQWRLPFARGAQEPAPSARGECLQKLKSQVSGSSALVYRSWEPGGPAQEHWSLAVALPVRRSFILCSLSSATSRGWRMIVQAFFPTPCAATAWLPKPKPTICSSLSQATATAQAPGL